MMFSSNLLESMYIYDNFVYIWNCFPEGDPPDSKNDTKEQQSEADIDPCTYHTIGEENYTRTFEYTLESYQNDDKCETMTLTPGWYRYSNYRNIPTEPAKPGQCGSWNPIWLKGQYTKGKQTMYNKANNV